MADPVILIPANLFDAPRVYLGAGKHRLPGWVHIDRHPFPGIEIVCDVTRNSLPYQDQSVGCLFTQDFLEHLPAAAKIPLMNEIWRVLAPGGTMEHWVPNAGSRNDFGSPSHLSHWNLQQFEHFDVDSYRWTVDREYEGFTGAFQRVIADEVNIQIENGRHMAQSIHVVYRAVAVPA